MGLFFAMGEYPIIDELGLGYFGQNKWCSLPATWVLIAVTEPLKIPCAGKLLSFKVQEISEGNCSVFNSPKRPKKNPNKNKGYLSK